LRWRHEFEQAMDRLALLPELIGHRNRHCDALAPAPAPVRAAGPSEAYELYVLGEHAWRPKTPEASSRRAITSSVASRSTLGTRATIVGAGWTWLGQSNYGAGLDWNEAFARATPLFDKALRLDPELAEAITAQGVLNTQLTHYDQARALFAQALKLSRATRRLIIPTAWPSTTTAGRSARFRTSSARPSSIR